MNDIVLVGNSGRMAVQLQKILKEKKQSFKIYSPNAPAELACKSFDNAKGVIDFSNPSTSKEVTELAMKAKVPLVCGTTGWENEDERAQCFAKASTQIPIVWDSNFSVGIEKLCQAVELIAKDAPADFYITDIHHSEKKDAPSGTALKLAERIQEANSNTSVHFHDIRAGNVSGEHRVFLAWGDECLEFVHRAGSRQIFAAGALQALDWLSEKKPGYYRMRDVLQC